MPSPRTSRRRKIAARILGLAFTLALAAWLGRDLPRRWVEATLAERLGAQASLERLELHGWRHFVLAGLTLEEIRDAPFVERLTIGELIVDGPPREMLDDRFERVRLRDVRARLAPAAAAAIPDRPLPWIGELVLEPARIHLAAVDGGEDSLLIVEATLRQIGGRPSGRATLRSPEVALDSLFAVLDPSAPPPLAGRLQEVEGELELTPEGHRLDARAADAVLSREGHVLELSGPRVTAELAGPASAWHLAAARAVATLAGRTASVDAPRLAVAVTPGGDGGKMRHLVITPELAWLASASLEADWDVAARRLRRLDARLEGLDLVRLLPAAGLDATVDLELHGAGERLDWTATIVPRHLILDPQRQLAAGGGSRLVAAGSLPFAPLAALEAPAWEGPLEVTLALPAARGGWRGHRLPPALLPLAARFEGRWQGFEPLRFAGDASLETAAAGRLEAAGELILETERARTDLTWTWKGGRLDRLAALLRDEGLVEIPFALAGTATAAGSLRGPLARPSLAGEVRFREIEADDTVAANTVAADTVAADTVAAGRTWRLAAGKATAAGGWAGPGQPLRVRSLAAEGTLEVPNLTPLPLVLDAVGWSLADGSQGEVTAAAVESPGLGVARLAGEWRRRGDRPIEAQGDLRLEGLDLGNWQDASEPAGRIAALADLELAGTAGAELAITADGAGAWRLAGPLDLQAAGFASADGSQVMEGLAGRVDLTARGEAAAPLEARATGAAGGFQLLWNTFFGDFSDVEAGLDVSGRWRGATADGPPAWELEARVELPAGPSAEATLASPPAASGGTTEAGLRYSIDVEDRDLAATHRRYLADLLADQLGRLELGGALTAHGRGSYHAADGERPAAWSLLGGLSLEDFHLTSGGGEAAVTGLDLELPLELRRRPGSEAGFTGPRLSGRLAFDRLDLRGLEVPATATDLLVEADSVGLEQPIALAILGGRLTFEQLTLRRLLQADRHLEAGIQVENVDLERVAQELELFPLAGALNGRFPLARLSPDLLQVEGGGRMEVFGGVVEVRDISGEDVLTRFPKLVLSADFRDVDLGALTRRIDFGEMTGILEGSLEDCELFRGVPVRFTARLATVERKGVRRTVDVKAIRNITILGTGAGTTVFDRGLQRFFQKYTYAALGVSLRLEQDRLLMRGLEHRGDKELFLRGRAPLRIDVVNAQPGKTVSFQTMVRRLQSLDFARARTER